MNFFWWSLKLGEGTDADDDGDDLGHNNDHNKDRVLFY